MRAETRTRDAMRRVASNDVIDYGTTVAYSTIYGASLKLVVATSHGAMKLVSAMADHYTGKSAEVMRAERRTRQSFFTHTNADH